MCGHANIVLESVNLMFNKKRKKRSLEKLRLQSVSDDAEKHPAKRSTQQRGAPFIAAA